MKENQIDKTYSFLQILNAGTDYNSDYDIPYLEKSDLEDKLFRGNVIEEEEHSKNLHLTI